MLGKIEATEGMALPLKNRAMEIPILYSDDQIVVIAKPAGLLSLPDGWQAELPHVRGVLEPQFGRLWVVHRLDKDTSGVMVLARTSEAHRALSIQFERRDVQKTYHAIVFGTPEWQHRRVSLRLSQNRGRRKRTVVDRRGKPAQTDFRVLRRFRAFSLIAAVPHTGRRHQVRVHLYALGFPIVNDPLYGENTADHPLPIHRLALHARRIEFTHPTTGKRVGFSAPHPPDFAAALENLEAYGDLYAE